MKFRIFKKEEKNKDKNLLVAASVIAAMAYQAAISPPGGVAQANAAGAPVPSSDYYELGPGDSVLAYFYSSLSNAFWIANTISLMCSLSVIFLYVSGFSLKRKIQVWTIRVAMWITLTSMTVAYVFAVIATTPSNDWANISSNINTLQALILGVIAWVILLCLSFLFLVYRFIRYRVRKIIKKNTIVAPDTADMV